MTKGKLYEILYKYSLDKGFLAGIIMFVFLSLFFTIGITEDILFIILTVLFALIAISMIINILVVRYKINRNEIETIEINNFEAFIKKTKKTNRYSSILVKLYIICENNKKYNYYYLNGSKAEFKRYKIIINKSSNVKLNIFKNTNIISSIIVDGEELKDLYYEIKRGKKLIKPIIYNHIRYKRTKKAIYKYEEYNIDDVQVVFENSELCEELYIINCNNKYVRISYDETTHKEFYIEKEKYNTFNELKEELEINNFIFDNKIRVIYTLDNTDPTSFNILINEV